MCTRRGGGGGGELNAIHNFFLAFLSQQVRAIHTELDGHVAIYILCQMHGIIFLSEDGCWPGVFTFSPNQ